jgi:predicted metal-dependent hydrolase
MPHRSKGSITDPQPIPYRLVRAKRRTIGLTVDDDGLTISAPRWVSHDEIDAAVTERQRWITRALQRWELHRLRRERLRIRWHDGESINLLGCPRIVELVAPATGAADGAIVDTGFALQINLAGGSDSEVVRSRLEPWFVERASQVIGQQVETLYQRSGLKPARWQLSNARTRWGSCSPKGVIRLNWRLIHFELAHLREMNHGPRFWRLVGAICPQWRTARAKLNEYPSDL